MKVAFLLGSLNRGGTETLMLDAFRHADDAGFEMICVYRKDGSLSEDFKKTTVPQIHLRPRFPGDLLYLYKLRKTLRNEKAAMVHAQQAIDALYALLALRGTGIKVVLTFHGYNYRYGWMRNLITRLIINRTALNIYVSNSQKEDYLENYRVRNVETQKVIYNGLSFEKFKSFEFRSIRNEFSLPEKSILLGSVGNFVRVRDQMTICRFLNMLNKSGFDFYFVFAGGKNYFEPERFEECLNYCQQHNLGDRVFFPGSRNDIPNFLSQLDAFIYSTHFDTFGIAVIEAMFMGIPVFYNNYKVLHEISEEGNHGIQYKSGDEYDLYNKFMAFIKNQKIVRQLSISDIQWVKNKYGIHTFLSSLSEAYRCIHDANTN